MFTDDKKTQGTKMGTVTFLRVDADTATLVIVGKLLCRHATEMTLATWVH